MTKTISPMKALLSAEASAAVRKQGSMDIAPSGGFQDMQAVFGLEREGAVTAATPEAVPDVVGTLLADRSRRIELANAARSAIDGKGPTRVVDVLEQLVSR